MLNYLRYLWRGQKRPLYVTFYAINKCNLRCKHCFYRSNLNKEDEISIENITKLAKSIKGVLNLSITGGEPFLRRDIEEVIQTFFRYAQPKIISIATNGFQSKIISDVILNILKNNKGIRLSITVSLDGFEEVHDKIRGKKGCFKHALQTIQDLKKIKKCFPNLNVGIIATLSDLNARIIPNFYDYASKLGIDSIQVNLIRGEPKKLDKESIQVYKQIADKTKSDVYLGNLKGYSNFIGGGIYKATNIMFREMIYKTVKTAEYQLPCAAGRLNGIIYPNGYVFACEMLDSTIMGNLKDYDFNMVKLWESRNADKVREFIYNTKCFCTHECQLTTSMLFNPLYFLKIITEYSKIKLSLLKNNLFYSTKIKV